MPSKFSRGNFFNLVTNPEGDLAADGLSFTFQDFIEFIEFRPSVVHTVVSDEVATPDLVSYREYGIETYWWIILLTNQIIDPIKELYLGREIAIPFLNDIEEFYQYIRTREIRGSSVSLT